VGAITIVYNHHTRELDHALTDLQHQSYHQIISALHVHLDAHNCLEVLVVKGKSHEMKRISDRLIGTKGVKHGKLVMTTTGKELDKISCNTHCMTASGAHERRGAVKLRCVGKDATVKKYVEPAYTS
jgi:hypothetical protein